MATITLRSVKGTPLTNNEVDANFTNLNNDKLEITGTAAKATSLAGGSANQIPYQSAVGTTAFISTGTTGQVLTSNGSGSAPTFQALATLPSQTGNTGKVLTTNGTTASWETPNTALSTYVGTNTITTVGTISSGTWQGSNIGMSYGGTGTNLSPQSGGIVWSNSTSLAIIAAGTSGQVLTSNGISAPTWKTVDSILPSLTGNSGKYLTNDGTNISWATAGDVTLTGVQTITNKTLVGPVVTGGKETKVTMASNSIDLVAGNYFSKTITGATTLSVTNVPTSGNAISFILDITNGGSSAITWWSNIKWAGGSAPSLTVSGRDVLGFFTHDGGTTWNGVVVGKGMV